jgi:hypothetical protein
VAQAIGPAGPPVYVASTAIVLAVVARNVGQPFFALLALGAALNLLVIIANGGVMPADPAALASVGLLEREPGTFSNTVAADGAALAFLGDNWATPGWFPFANVVSIGDLLIGVGAAAWVATASRRPRRDGLAARLAARGALLTADRPPMPIGQAHRA